MKRKTKISQTTRQIVFARDGWICIYCSKEPAKWEMESRGKSKRICLIPIDEQEREFELDHIVPYSETQDNSISNLVMSCWGCNNKKSNRKWKISKNYSSLKNKQLK